MGRGEAILHPNSSPNFQKPKCSWDSRIQQPPSPYCAFIPTGKYYIPSSFGFPLWYFSALIVYFLQNYVWNPCVVCLNWGAVWDGYRPILGFGMNLHVTSTSFLIFFMFEIVPTKCSVKCLNGLCVWYCEVWLGWVCLSWCVNAWLLNSLYFVRSRECSSWSLWFLNTSLLTI